MYCIIFYYFKHNPSPYNISGKLRKRGLEVMGWFFFFNLLHEPILCMLPSGQGTLVVPQTHGGGLVLEIFTPNELLCSS